MSITIPLDANILVPERTYPVNAKAKTKIDEIVLIPAIYSRTRHITALIIRFL